jgi:hypothetical protein
MKKLITLFITCLLGTIASWAETGDITALPYTLNYASSDDPTTPFDKGTVATGTNVTAFYPGRNNTATAYFDTDDVADERTPYTLSTNEVVTLSFTAYHGWWAYAGGGTISFVNSDGTVLAGYTYNNNSTQVTDVTIGGSTVSDFTAFGCQSAFNASGSANGFTGSNKPYLAAEASNPKITITITQTGYVTFSIKVTNPKSGNVDRTFSAQMPSTVKTDLAKITFASTDSRSGGEDRSFAINNLSITSEISQATYYGYTINYLYDENTIKSVQGQAEAGTVISAANPVTVDNVKYYAVDGATLSLTVGTTESANVLSVNLREAGKKTVSVNAVAGSEVLQTWSGERIEGNDAANIYFNRAVKYGDDYYTTPRTGSYFAKSMSYTSSDVNVDYTHDESIVYYAETENMNISGDVSIVGANAERASGGNWRRVGKSTSVYTDQLTPGVYKIEIYGRNQSSSADAELSLQTYDGSTFTDTEKTFTLGKAATGEVTIENVELGNAASFAIVNTSADYVSNISLDYVIVYKTGDVEQITITASGYASYVTTNALDFSDVDGLTAYQAVNKDDEKVMLEKVTEVPAETPIIVKGTAGETYSIPVGTCNTELTGNILNGSSTTGYTVEDGYAVYALRASTGKMHPVNAGVTIPAKKAYLKLSGVNNAKALTLCFVEEEEEATAIATATADTQEKAAKFFNAAGQQVSKNYNGMVIDENGNKYIK